MKKLISVELRNFIEKNDALNLIKWLDDFEVVKYMNESKDISNVLTNILDNRQEVLLTYYLNKNCVFHMVDYENDSVGFVSLIPNLNNQYEVVIAIGDKENWGQKIGHSALEKTIFFAFNELKCQKIVAKIHNENTRSIKLFENLGFKKENYANKFILYSLTN